jgi:hypothetical protein
MQYLQCPFTRENWRLLSKSALKAGKSQRAYSYLHSDTLFSIECRSHPLLLVYWDWHPGMTGLRVWSINHKEVLFRSAIRSDEIDSSVLAGVCHRFPRDNCVDSGSPFLFRRHSGLVQNRAHAFVQHLNEWNLFFHVFATSQLCVTRFSHYDLPGHLRCKSCRRVHSIISVRTDS